MSLSRIINTLLFYLLIIISVINESNNASLNLEQNSSKSFMKGEGLYSADDDVEILTASNFKNKLYGKPYAWIVEFYNSWCGFCQRFAPSWKALGTDIRGWNDLIKVGAIDCYGSDNNPICRDFDIMAYPKLRYFHANYSENPNNIGLDVDKGEDVNGHKKNLLSTIISEQKKEGHNNFPNLQPYEFPTFDNLYNAIPNDHHYTFIVFQNSSSLIGPEVILDMHNIKNITILYVDSGNLQLRTHLDITKEPTLCVIENKEKLHILGDGYEFKNQLIDAIKVYLNSKGIILPQDDKPKDIFKGKWINVPIPDISDVMKQREQQALKERVKKMGDVVFQMDLETALRYSLKHEIGSVKFATGEKLEAMKNYLTIVSKYFPFGRNGQIFLTELRSTVELGGETLPASEVYEIIETAEHEDQEVYSSPPNWLGCKGSSPRYRGYPCGLWKMFHYFTVSASEQNVFKGDQNPREVLDAMHGYVKYFFGCADCSQHFQQMAVSENMKNVSSHDSAILWLWMAHNNVNRRLAGDVTEDPEYPKYQFPSTERCPSCQFSNGTWNFSEVLKYLKNMYSSINIRYIGSDTRIVHMGLEGSAFTSSRSSSIFKTVDTSMYFFLYIFSFMLLIAVIRLFLKRGYRKKIYMHDLLGKV